MIVRLYKARVKPGKESEWERIIQTVALPLMRKQGGLEDAFYTWDTWNGAKEFVFVSLWRSLDDIKKFAGKNWEQAVVPEEEKPLLVSTTVTHFEPLRGSK